MADEVPIDALKAIAHPVRFRLLQVLQQGERNVGEIEEASGVGQPSLSQQLAVLRTAGLVETRKEAKLVYYTLARKALGELASLLAGFGDGTAPAAPSRPTPAPTAANFARLS